ncbi:hypothetical protein GHT06_011100 [Daphnia sinensis]|uniref:Uncharacterized protein n=1 Tax=Daphnia sinensis TaxID=1820382 RepID=A0AAD5LJ24_9CRUS|nr:hypothetical protein GHT06_011100 [Daphnia sinensis]
MSNSPPSVSEMTFHSLKFLLIFSVCLAAVKCSAVPVNNDVEMVPENRASTVTVTVSSTANGATTSVLSTKLVCAILYAPLATTACRRKRQFWGIPIFYMFGQSELEQQFDSLDPTQVLGVESSVLTQVRNAMPHNPGELNSPLVVQSSFDGIGQDQQLFRVANPFFFRPIASAISNAFNNLFGGPPVTRTLTSTIYTTTVTRTLFTSTATYTLSSLPCVPAEITLCPAAPITRPTTTDAPVTTDATTDATSPTSTTESPTTSTTDTPITSTTDTPTTSTMDTPTTSTTDTPTTSTTDTPTTSTTDTPTTSTTDTPTTSTTDTPTTSTTDTPTSSTTDTPTSSTTP